MANEGTTILRTATAGDPVLAEVVRRLLEAYRPERIWLFGSVARGEAGPDSDYDLMVVVPDDTPPEQQRSRAGYRAVRDLSAARDMRQLHLKASFPSTVAREGIILY